MKALLDKQQFGPWALVTGASSGIGPEFARQIAAAGINLVLVARREALLNEVGRHITRDFGVQFRALTMDLSQEGFLPKLADIQILRMLGELREEALLREVHREGAELNTKVPCDMASDLDRKSVV